MIVTRLISRVVSRFRCFWHMRAYRATAGITFALTFFLPHPALATTVRMVTTLGTIDIELYDDQAPKTVVNFLRYAGRGDYSTNGFIHRSVPGFAIQGGGFTYIDFFGQPYYIHIPEGPPVPNEFSPSRSNVRGTIAMAKLGGNPDSATSEWFFNLTDNSANLDSQNGGFTVFGHVLDPGMNVVDAIASVPTFNASATNAAFTNIPLINYDPAAGIGMQPSNLVYVTDIPNVTATRTFSTGTTSVYAADVDMTLSNPDSHATVDKPTSASWLAAFTPPAGMTVIFADEISRFTLSGNIGAAGRVVTLYHGAATSVNGYYAYGPTVNEPSPHWYDFSYDGVTGAEIVGNKVLLHFVDGQRGDDDLTANDSITHTGAPVLVTDSTTGSSNSAGCAIATTPSRLTSHGDWILVSMFFAFVALIRRRANSEQDQDVTNIASP